MQEPLRKVKEKGEISIENTNGTAIVGIYGWIGLCMTEGLIDEERMKRMRQIWYRLSDLAILLFFLL